MALGSGYNRPRFRSPPQQFEDKPKPLNFGRREASGGPAWRLRPAPQSLSVGTRSWIQLTWGHWEGFPVASGIQTFARLGVLGCARLAVLALALHKSEGIERQAGIEGLGGGVGCPEPQNG